MVDRHRADDSVGKVSRADRHAGDPSTSTPDAYTGRNVVEGAFKKLRD